MATGPAVENFGVFNAGAASAPSMRHVVCRAIGATGVNRGCLTAYGAQPTMVDIDAEAVGGTTARALENFAAGAGLSMTRARAVASGASSENVGFINDQSSPRIVDLAVFANGTGSAAVYGIQIVSSSPNLGNVAVSAGGSTSGIIAGIYVSGATSAPTIAEAVVTATGSSTNTFGVWNADSTTPTLTKFNISVFGGGGGSIAILNSTGSQVSLTEGTATASAPAGVVIGVKNLGASVQLTSVIATATGGAGSTRNGLFNDAGTSTVSVDRSTLTGASNSVFNTSSSVLRIGGSQLVGPVTTIGGAVTSCVLSYNGSYTGLDGVCL